MGILSMSEDTISVSDAMLPPSILALQPVLKSQKQEYACALVTVLSMSWFGGGPRRHR